MSEPTTRGAMVAAAGARVRNPHDSADSHAVDVGTVATVAARYVTMFGPSVDYSIEARPGLWQLSGDWVPAPVAALMDQGFARDESFDLIAASERGRLRRLPCGCRAVGGSGCMKCNAEHYLST